jgi:hypothetical protein
MRALFVAVTVVGSVAALVVPTAGVAAKKPPSTPLDLSLCAPDQNTFTTNITNPYFPLPIGQQWVYQGREKGQTVGLRITVLNQTERLYSGRNAITTVVVEEVEWFDLNANGVIDPGEPLIEVSRNYFAQTQDGTVCYFGEHVDIYEDGVIVSNEGSWRADEPGNQPGIFMPASPQVGQNFQQEVAPGIAEDQATIIGTGTYTLPDGTVVDTIIVRDFNPLDRSRGTKVYGFGVGLLVDGPVSLISVSS